VLGALALVSLASGCRKSSDVGVKAPVASNNPTVNLFGFEESQLHHIQNTVELHHNVFLVRYDPAKPRMIEWVNCPVEANYSYQKSNGRRVESMYVRSRAELEASVPVSAARFEAYVKGGKALEFNYVTIGSYELMSDFRIPKNDPDCARATHYVVTLSLGAFAFSEEGSVEGGVRASAKGTGAGVAASGSRGKGEMTAVGDLESCMDDGKAATQCFSPLQLLMRPIASRHWGDDAAVEADRQDRERRERETPPEKVDEGSYDLALSVDENEWRPGSFMAKALERLLLTAARLNNNTDYGFDDKDNTVLAGFVTKDHPQTITRPFEPGRSYAVFAAGATESNVDLRVYDSSGQLVAADEAGDGEPAVVFKPTSTDPYRIELSLVDASEEFGALAVMVDGGVRIPTPILQKGFQRLLNAGTHAAKKTHETGSAGGLVFHEQGWSLQGVVLYGNEGIRRMVRALGPEPAVFSAVSHDESINIDLEVIEMTTEKTWADKEPDGNPLVLVEEPREAATYEMRILYGAPEDAPPALATALVLEMRP